MKQVLCIDNKDLDIELTLNKVYQLLNESEDRYTIIDDSCNKGHYYKSNFKIVDVYSFNDLLDNPIDTQFEVRYEKGGIDASYINVKQYSDDRGKYLKWDSVDEDNFEEVTINEKILKATFIRVEKQPEPVSFQEVVNKDCILCRVEHEHINGWLSYQSLQKVNEYLEFNQLMELLSELPSDELKIVLKYGRWYIKEIGKSY